MRMFNLAWFRRPAPPPPPAMRAKVVIAKSTRDRWRWQLEGPDGKCLALMPGNGFKRHEQAEASARAAADATWVFAEWEDD